MRTAKLLTYRKCGLRSSRNASKFKKPEAGKKQKKKNRLKVGAEGSGREVTHLIASTPTTRDSGFAGHFSLALNRQSCVRLGMKPTSPTRSASRTVAVCSLCPNTTMA